jgi:hypothetical protein
MGIEKLSYPVDARNIPSKKIPLHFKGVLTGKNELTTLGQKTLFIEEYIIDTKRAPL